MPGGRPEGPWLQAAAVLSGPRGAVRPSPLPQCGRGDFSQRAALMREGVGAELELDDERARQGLWRRPWRARRRRVNALDMLRRAVTRSHPQRTALPAGLRVVDAAFEPLGEKAHRIGDAQFDEFAVHQRVQGIRLVAGFERHIGAEPEDVVLVDPDVIRVFLDAGSALKTRPRQRIQIKALGAFLALLGARPVQRPLAFLAVEAGEIA